MNVTKRWVVLMILLMALALPVSAQDATEEATEPPVEETDLPGEQPTEEVTEVPGEEPTEESTAAPTDEPASEATEPAGPPPAQLPPLPPGAEIVAQGLDYPRKLVIGPDGRLYVGLVGPGGDSIIQTPDGDMPFGMSASVVAIAEDGTQEAVIKYLPSAASIAGAADVAFSEDGLWVIVNGPGPQAVPEFLMSSALLFNAQDYNLLTYVDLYTYEVTFDPDGNGLDTNPTDIEIGPDGTIYMLDTGANTLYTWTPEGGLVPFIVWPDNPVPTGLAFDAEGNLWVSYLGAELAPGAGKVEQFSPEGELLASYGGYNTLTDVAIAPDGSVYVVSLFAGFGPEGPLPGQILRVGETAGEVVVDGLTAPYGIVVDDAGNLLVSTGTSFLPPGAGMILRFTAPAM